MEYELRLLLEMLLLFHSDEQLHYLEVEVDTERVYTCLPPPSFQLHIQQTAQGLLQLLLC